MKRIVIAIILIVSSSILLTNALSADNEIYKNKSLSSIENYLKDNKINDVIKNEQRHMLFYKDNKEIFYWKVGYNKPLKIIENVDNIKWSFNNKEDLLLISAKDSDSYNNYIFDTYSCKVIGEKMPSIGIPLWSPKEDLLVAVNSYDNKMYLNLYDSRLRKRAIIYSVGDNMDGLELLSWDKNNVIKYNEYNKGINILREYSHLKYIPSIVGKSINLSKRATKAMYNWREEIRNVARHNINDIFISGSKNSKKIAITIDDGPDNVITPQLLKVLRELNVPASFFVVGEKAIKYPNVVKQIHEEGHLVLNHSLTHANFDLSNESKVRKEIKETQEIINNIIGKRPLLLRTPYGIVNDKVLSITQEFSNKIVLWSIDTLDWSQREHNNIAANVLNKARNGDIILLHGEKNCIETVKALPLIINGLKERGFEIVLVSDLIEKKAYK